MTAPYRDDLDALSARHAALSDELSSVRERLRDADSLKQQEERLAGEVASLAAKLDGMKAKRALPLLESIKIASPCTASWDEMKGDERVRYCGHCEKNVYNLSGMERDEAEKLVRERSTEICVRLYQRQDGTVITADCPVGVRRKRRRRLFAATAAAVGSGLAAYPMFAHTVHQGEVDMRMGGMAIDAPEPPAPPRAVEAPPPAEPQQVTMGRMPLRPVAAPPEKTTGKTTKRVKHPETRPVMGKL